MTDLPEKELGNGLRAAFAGQAPDASVLRALAAKPLRLQGAEAEPATAATGRYQLVGELARGGMGVIYRGRDVDLGRDVAIKVLRAEFKEDDAVTERFVEEAQIGGQLQHPGIVPVYELGLDEERRPYFSMKLVKGKTLAALLKEGATSRRRLLGILEQVCQTMAYAHARGVVHRDLKPANIMVGAFGEVQVVDWGFAKVLRQGGTADEQPRPDISVIATVRSDGEGSDSIAGSVMGTPAYMPPEQALGQVEALDERSDVFSLGAILFEILAGGPLYRKDEGDNLMVQAAQCRIDEPLARLEGDELEPLLRECLAPRQADRPRNAAHVARAVSRHLAAVEERAHRARVAAAEAHVRARAERRKRTLTLALGAALLLALLLGGGSWWALDQRRRERTAARQRAARAAIAEATFLLGRAKLAEAREAARRAVQLHSTPASRALLEDLQAELESARAERAQAQRDAAFVAALQEIRSLLGHGLDPADMDARLAAAFRKYGMEPTKATTAREAVRLPAALALVSWANLKRSRLDREAAAWVPLIESAQALDPDPLRNALREAIKRGERDEIRRVAEKEDPKGLPAPTVAMFGRVLLELGLRDTAIDWLRRGQRAHPGDFLINYDLGVTLRDDEGVRYLVAALALNPENVEVYHHLGIGLARDGRVDEAIEVWRDAVRLRPTYARALAHIGFELYERGDAERAEATFAEARRIDPADGHTYTLLGHALKKRDPARALAAYDEAIRLRPTPWDLNNAAWIRATSNDPALRDPEEAVRLARQAVQKVPYRWGHWNTLGVAYYQAGDWKNARAAMERAERLQASPYNQCILALIHWQRGDHDQARQYLAKAKSREHEFDDAVFARFLDEACRLIRQRR